MDLRIGARLRRRWNNPDREMPAVSNVQLPGSGTAVKLARVDEYLNVLKPTSLKEEVGSIVSE
jgi:hypothetical protein